MHARACLQTCMHARTHAWSATTAVTYSAFCRRYREAFPPGALSLSRRSRSAPPSRRSLSAPPLDENARGVPYRRSLSALTLGELPLDNEKCELRSSSLSVFHIGIPYRRSLSALPLGVPSRCSLSAFHLCTCQFSSVHASILLCTYQCSSVHVPSSFCARINFLPCARQIPSVQLSPPNSKLHKTNALTRNVKNTQRLPTRTATPTFKSIAWLLLRST